MMMVIVEYVIEIQTCAVTVTNCNCKLQTNCKCGNIILSVLMHFES